MILVSDLSATGTGGEKEHEEYFKGRVCWFIQSLENKTETGGPIEIAAFR